MVQELGSISADIMIRREMPKNPILDSGSGLWQDDPAAITADTGKIGGPAVRQSVGLTVSAADMAVGLAAGQAAGNSGPLFILDAVIRPWQYSRRLPLRKQWLVYTDEGWLPLEGGRYELTGEKEQWPAHLRFRLEIHTPDGELEYRAEKAVEVPVEPEEEDNV
jgi:hypothetical protein